MPKNRAATLEKKIHEVRPRIEDISPIAGRGVLGFGLLNVFLGYSLFTLSSRFIGDVAILNAIFDYQFWGAMFTLSGSLMLIGYAQNHWDLMRWMLVITLFFKLVWLFGLLFRFAFSYDNTILLLLWSALTYFQMLFYLYFLPRPSEGGP